MQIILLRDPVQFAVCKTNHFQGLVKGSLIREGYFICKQSFCVNKAINFVLGKLCFLWYLAALLLASRGPVFEGEG